MIAKILINTTAKSLNKVYDYNVPKELENSVEIGKRVEVSFGKSSKSEGIIVKLIKDEENNQNKEKEYVLKDIVSVLDEYSYINESRLKLAKYISYIYFCNVYDALKLMLPPGTTSKNQSKSIYTKQEIKIILVKDKEEIERQIENKTIKSAKQIQVLRFLCENNYVLQKDITSGLGLSKSILSTLEKNGYIILEKFTPKNDLLIDNNIPRTEKQIPTDEQKIAIDKISNYIFEEKYKQCLLFGVTGSGKTEVYLQVLENVLKKGKQL